MLLCSLRARIARSMLGTVPCFRISCMSPFRSNCARNRSASSAKTDLHMATKSSLVSSWGDTMNSDEVRPHITGQGRRRFCRKSVMASPTQKQPSRTVPQKEWYSRIFCISVFASIARASARLFTPRKSKNFTPASSASASAGARPNCLLTGYTLAATPLSTIAFRNRPSFCGEVSWLMTLPPPAD